MKHLIAEIGSNHLGDMDMAKRMILAARDAGATLAKLQAYRAVDVAGKGSMPKEFYEACELRLEEFEELIYFGRIHGIETFCSIFSDKFAPLVFTQKYKKVAGSQATEQIAERKLLDMPNTFVSLKEGSIFAATQLKQSIPLYVTDYMVFDPKLINLGYLSVLAEGQFGYSDHTVGTEACKVAIKTFGATVIEKHFTLQKNLTFQGETFRDTVHGASQAELEDIAKTLFS